MFSIFLVLVLVTMYVLNLASSVIVNAIQLVNQSLMHVHSTDFPKMHHLISDVDWEGILNPLNL